MLWKHDSGLVLPAEGSFGLVLPAEGGFGVFDWFYRQRKVLDFGSAGRGEFWILVLPEEGSF